MKQKKEAWTMMKKEMPEAASNGQETMKRQEYNTKICGKCHYFNNTSWLCGRYSCEQYVKPHHRSCEDWEQADFPRCKDCRFYTGYFCERNPDEEMEPSQAACTDFQEVLHEE